MFAELRLELDTDKLDYRQSSNLQGVIYEHIASEYVEKMHFQQLHPYSQCLLQENETPVWYIRTMDDEAYEQIIQVLEKDDFQLFLLRKQDRQIEIKSKQIRIVQQQELLQEFYDIKGERYINLQIQTPTAFKQSGRYVFFPDIRLLYQSLMNKYSAIAQGIDMQDEDTLEQLTANSEIVRYRLRSIRFPLEGITVPGFVGDFTIKLHGTDTMARYARMLMRFGEFSGIGIKTAMGMGAIRTVDGGKKNG